MRWVQARAGSMGERDSRAYWRGLVRPIPHEEELKNCIDKAYDSKFDTEEIAPLDRKSVV